MTLKCITTTQDLWRMCRMSCSLSRSYCCIYLKQLIKFTAYLRRWTRDLPKHNRIQTTKSDVLDILFVQMGIHCKDHFTLIYSTPWPFTCMHVHTHTYIHTHTHIYGFLVLKVARYEASIQKQCEGCANTAWGRYWLWPQFTCCQDLHPTEDQFGFRRGKETRNANGMLRIISEWTLEIDVELCVCFIDWQKAFDKVNWIKLMQILRRTGIDWQERRLISNLYMAQSVKVQMTWGEKRSVKIGRGCCLSPILFTLYSECHTKEGLKGFGDFTIGG